MAKLTGTGAKITFNPPLVNAPKILDYLKRDSQPLTQDQRKLLDDLAVGTYPVMAGVVGHSRNRGEQSTRNVRRKGRFLHSRKRGKPGGATHRALSFCGTVNAVFP